MRITIAPACATKAVFFCATRLRGGAAIGRRSLDEFARHAGHGRDADGAPRIQREARAPLRPEERAPGASVPHGERLDGEPVLASVLIAARRDDPAAGRDRDLACATLLGGGSTLPISGL